MKCSQARDLFHKVWCLSADDPKQLAFHIHLAECPDCAAQFELLQCDNEMSVNIPEPILEEQVHRINFKVMERIYAESPWLFPDEPRIHHFPSKFRKHFSLWMSACVALFLCSFVYLLAFPSDFSKQDQDYAMQTGILPTGAISSDHMVPSNDTEYKWPETINQAGIIEPFKLTIPKYPSYWMALSIFALLLALFFLRMMYVYAKQNKKTII